MMRIGSTAARTAAVALALAPLMAGASEAQGTGDRTPNLWTAWSPVPGVVQFNFLHRFDVSDAPLRKLTNTPSFQVASGITRSLGVGFVYGSNSDLVDAYPNEWEWFARWAPLSQREGAIVDTWLQAGWNVAAESFDAELTAARSLGPLRLLVAGRALDHAFYRDETRYAVAGGAALRLTRSISIAGDYGALIDRLPDERPAWSAALQLSVPYTPHSLSIHAGNVGTSTLEGASRGSHTRWGFEYTVPITLRRFAPRREERGAAMADTRAGEVPGGMHANGAPDTVVVTISGFQFRPQVIEINAEDVVIWRNAETVAHTVTADTGSFESPLIDPGKEWSRRFTRPGTYIYHCTPHPFMKAEIRVKGMTP